MNTPPPTRPDATQVILGTASVPVRLAQYVLERKVGAGAMGAVYLARDTDLDRPVAIKLLHATWATASARQQGEERFLQEARAAARLSHPNVAVVYQVGHDDERSFIAMEWIDGSDLGQVVAHGPLPWRVATAAVRDAAAGLAAAHAVGLVHRDIKPSNLMRAAAGGVKLVDFGLARLQEAHSDLTATGSIMGTPAYLSPELFHGDAATPASDIYSLACTYFHLLTGRVPFPGSHLVAVMTQHVNAPMPDPRERAPDVPEAVARIVARGAAKRPAERYPDAATMLVDLQAALDGREIDPPRAGGFATAGPVQGRVGPAPAADTAPAHGNLPAEAGAFIGREVPAAQLVDRLGRARLVTVTGPGGTGKTRLALHVARRMARDWTDGAWLVELAALPAGGDATLATATVFGVGESTGSSIDDALTRHLRPLRALIVLDNCEHLVDSASRLAHHLLATCPQVQLLVTSRQPLGVPGEAVFALPPMALAGEDLPEEALAEVESVRLFVERAAAARSGFTLASGAAVVVAQICRRLDGIPLAIELAAARVKVLSPQQIAARLDDAFGLLTTGQRVLQPRQQTLRALIDWSWELLDAAERRALARCSVFAGEFSLEAAEAVLADAAVDALAALAGLVDKSLLVAVERDGAVRYALLQTIRLYAADRLDAAETLDAQQRHARFYLAWVTQASHRFGTTDHAAAMACIAREHEQAKAALDAACANRWFDIVLPLGDGLAQYGYLAGLLADGVERVRRLLDTQPPPSAQTALLLRRGADLAVRCGQLDTARGWLVDGLAMARSTGAAELVAGLLNGLGALAYSQGSLEAAEGYFSESLALCREAGHRDHEVKAINNLAMVVRRMGRAGDAREHYLNALALLRGSPNGRLIGYLKVNLGELEVGEGRADAARSLFEEAIEGLVPLGEEWGIALARGGLGDCALAAGDVAAARREFGAALTLLRKVGESASTAEVLDDLARTAWIEGQAEEAGACAREALGLRLAAANPSDIAASLATWAELLAHAHPGHAARLLGCAEAVRAAERAPLDTVRRQAEQALLDALALQLGGPALALARAEGARADAASMARALVDAQPSANVPRR